MQPNDIPSHQLLLLFIAVLYTSGSAGVPNIPFKWSLHSEAVHASALLYLHRSGKLTCSYHTTPPCGQTIENTLTSVCSMGQTIQLDIISVNLFL